MRKVGLVLSPGFQAICFVAFTAFEIANKRSGKTLYDLHVLSEKGGPLRSSFGMEVTTESLDDSEFDTLLVVGGLEVLSTSPSLAIYLQKAAKSTRRLASI